MATTSPLARVKQEFGGKDKLVDKIVGLIDAGDESKDDLRKRLLGAANRKLIRLHSVATQVKGVGGRDQIAAAAAQELGKGKDKDYVAKLSTFSSGRLVDMLNSAKNRNARKTRKSGAAPRAKSTTAAAPTKGTPAAKAKRAPAKKSSAK
jgi:hypothetical protein